MVKRGTDFAPLGVHRHRWILYDQIAFDVEVLEARSRVRVKWTGGYTLLARWRVQVIGLLIYALIRRVVLREAVAESRGMS